MVYQMVQSLMTTSDC